MNSLLTLVPGEIHLWLSFFNEVAQDRLSEYRELLTAEEKQKAERFYFAEDRRRYLVTRAILRTVLSRYVDKDPKTWRFANNPYGRPEIANIEAADRYLSFNLSHTSGLIVLGVTSHCTLGVDVENLLTRQISIEIAEHFFSSVEAAALQQLPRRQQQYRFFEYWTFKEAYIKARGMGLSLPLDKFSFSYPHDGSVDIAIHPELQDDPSRWRFLQFKPSNEHLIAVCAERVATRSRRLVIRKFLSLANEEMLDLVPTRVSI